MTHLTISGLPQWQVTTVTDGVKRTQQIGALTESSVSRALTGVADRVSISMVMVNNNWSSK